MSRNFFKSVVEKPQSCTCGGARPRTKMVRLVTAPIGYAYHNDRNKRLDFCKKIIHTPPMKIKKKIFTRWAFRLYVAYSITADLLVIGGIVYIIFF